jgi:uncharacterized protein YeaO (DUF488 family)
MPIQLKRVYEPAEPSDGYRVLVERLWPRGVAKEAAKLDHWAKEVAPSTALRTWFAHDPERFEEFRRRYIAELEDVEESVAALRKRARGRPVTLVFSSKEARFNNAVVLKELLESGR